MSTTGPRPRPLPIIPNQIRTRRCHADLPQHRHDLPPVVGRVVDDVEECLDQRVALRLALRVAVLQGAAQVRVVEAGEDRLALALDRVPRAADRLERREVHVLRERTGRVPLPALEPDPVRAHDVREGAVDGAEAAPQVPHVSLGVERGHGVQDLAVGPAGVGEEVAYHLDHGSALG